ncbi:MULTISPECIES: NUDIX hydrolase [Thermomonospora]|uniref:8-oxo-dGTP diphosphatase n=1 Tax=Thermomonospora cellulosilytica TaxID=1411118 RepID=A0A7W3R6S2_9ACTN|nr:MULTISPECIES: NUDIX domain-containing protein [Thermomonospora]MBA9002488.1 8-oxo-dGTP diphosphatase [Thermomonospora cellulosilytica]
MGDSGSRNSVIRAAGAVLWREGPAGPEIALVHRPKYDDWSFPKGKLDRGEHVLRAALREVEEETGVAIRLGRRLPTTTYLKDGRPKRVDYWSASPVNGAAFRPNDEVDLLEWRTVDEAARLLTYERDVDLLHEFAAGPLRTRPVVVLRHASAGEKSQWRDLDALRPLDAQGRREAGLLARLLGAFGPARLHSSLTARCLETLLPYSLATGIEPVTELAFTVGRATAERACARLVELVEATDGPLVVCTHGEIVADLVIELCRRYGEKVPEDPSLRKAGFWVAHLGGDQITGRTSIAALERHSTEPR